ncbi:MAG: prepilin-type N-terminal cleavage/methylation domain-containing protein [Nitrospinae bacterium]|nr:prepilin-type N-terminal cleavage/methylation domain-containing protein [Nitrospinota bacterium]
MNNRYFKKNKFIKIAYKNRKGFTFIEVLIAIAILSIGLLGLATMSTTASKFNTFSKNKTTAIALGQDKMEELKRIIPTTTLTSANNAVENNINEKGEAGSGIFTRSVTITGGAAQLTTLAVTITWRDYSLHTVTLTTMIRQS